MTFAEALHGGRFPVALEITPPQKPLPAVLLRRATLLGGAASAVNVIQRPGRQSSLDASIELLGGPFEPVWHLVTRGAARTEVRAQLQAAATAGIRQLLCIRGDHAGGDSVDTPTIRETVAMAREIVPGATIGATLNQYAPDSAAAMRNLLPKLQAGASYVQTQPVFELATLRPAAEAVKAALPGAAVVAMVMPVLTLVAAEKLETRIGMRLPERLRGGMASGGMAAWEYFDETLATLAESPLVDGIAIMTLEMDAPEGIGPRIVQGLRSSGCLRS
ncbi:MAG: methylenetetrahydrofolate reductase [Tepidiformaceae bacterium]